MKEIYISSHGDFLDRIIIKKRLELCDFINKKLNKSKILNVLDIGTTKDIIYRSSNFIVKNLKNIQQYKSLSNQIIKDKFFQRIVTANISKKIHVRKIHLLKSDLVISNATIEHVGNFKNQLEMVKNMKNLTRKIFILITPNRYHPLEFHTKIPLIHWLPKKIHRIILKFLNLSFFSYEKNLNLLSVNDIKILLKKAKVNNYKIFYLYFLGFKSNIIVIAKRSINSN